MTASAPTGGDFRNEIRAHRWPAHCRSVWLALSGRRHAGARGACDLNGRGADRSYHAQGALRQLFSFPRRGFRRGGGLPGSDAHRPMVRVSMNQRAYGALDAGRLPEGGAFPDGSVVVKEIRDGAVTTLLAVMVRDRDNPLSGQGWLWAEYTPEGPCWSRCGTRAWAALPVTPGNRVSGTTSSGRLSGSGRGESPLVVDRIPPYFSWGSVEQRLTAIRWVAPRQPVVKISKRWPMRIGIDVRKYSDLGIGTYIRTLLTEFDARLNHDVVLFASPEEAERIRSRHRGEVVVERAGSTR
ncbi:MAG: hypothetical protein MZV64_28465 [Ignavibacteriales bacterium]|nr:hypothetical protein [Ignavibacteriales bacterium]